MLEILVNVALIVMVVLTFASAMLGFVIARRARKEEATSNAVPSIQPPRQPGSSGAKSDALRRLRASLFSNALIRVVASLTLASAVGLVAVSASTWRSDGLVVVGNTAQTDRPVPDVTGEVFENAMRKLERLGFAVVERPALTEGVADGLVISQDPPAGAAAGRLVTLTVSRQPVVHYLSRLEPVDVDAAFFNSGTMSLNGEVFTNSVAISADADLRSQGTAVAGYDLSRDYRRLVGVVGLDDRAAIETTYRVEIYGDDRSLFSAVIAFGSLVPLDLDVTEVSLLSIVVTELSGDGAVVFGDPRVQGLAAEVGDES